MSGIYIHIPFCRKKCNYCDFYSEVNLDKRLSFLKCLKKEIASKKIIFKNKNIETLYIGGGTPSVFSAAEIQSIINIINDNYNLNSEAEITLEINPNDNKNNYLKSLKGTSVNRLSIGIQSFFDDDLNFLGRLHNSETAIKTIQDAKENGFSNFSIDIIYGIHRSNTEKLNKNLEYLLKYSIPHFSAYHITYEEDTDLFVKLKQNKFSALTEQESIEQFDHIIRFAEKHNYEHYEISNFGKNSFLSKHNTNYWKNKEYLGFGPGAHSYYQNKRFFSPKKLANYINHNGIIKAEEDFLSKKDKFNEYIMTGLRTKWGVNKNIIKEKFGNNYSESFRKKIKIYSENYYCTEENNNVILTKKGLLISDSIISDLFIV